MDVTCERCGTRYEFDEALVSARGTTVKCTSCGHQFKVFRSDGSQELDGWSVRTIDGRELTFHAMRELQAAITTGQISRDDVIIPKSGGEPRRLAHIEELRSFFASDEEVPTVRDHGAQRKPSTYTEHKGTLLGGTAAPRDAEPPASPPPASAPKPARSGSTLRPPGIPPEPKTIPRGQHLGDDVDDLAATATDDEPAPGTPRRSAESSGSMAVPLPQNSQYGTDEAVSRLSDAVVDVMDDENAAEASRAARKREAIPSVTDEDTIGDPDSVEAGPEEVAASGEPSQPPASSEPAASEEVRPSSIDPLTPTPSVQRPSILRHSDVHSDPRFSGYRRGRRPGIARWVVGIVGLGLAAVIGFTFFERELVPGSEPAPTTTADGRVDTFLERGEEQLTEGNIDRAEELFVKASAIAEKDPRVARALARVAVIRADMLWLHKRLTKEGTPHHDAVAHQLDAAVERARETLDKASKTAPDHPITASLRVDVLRLEGTADEARERVAALDGAGPEGGRALAALDLTEQEPSFGTVLDRLRTAARAERKLGRARAMLVYALVRADKHEQAHEELQTLRRHNPSHPLRAVLEHFVEGTEPPEEAPEEPKTTAQRPRGNRPVTDRPKPGSEDEAEPFATSEPDLEDQPEPNGDGTGSPEPPPPEPPPPPPDDDLPPGVDVSDLPEYH